MLTSVPLSNVYRASPGLSIAFGQKTNVRPLSSFDISLFSIYHTAYPPVVLAGSDSVSTQDQCQSSALGPPFSATTRRYDRASASCGSSLSIATTVLPP